MQSNIFSSTFKNYLLRRSSLRIIRFLQLNLFSTLPKRYPKSKAKDEDKRLFTINYLITRFGFNPDRAVSASNHVTFDTSEKPDSVVSFKRLFTMNYLGTRFGFTPDRAASVCKYTTFGDPEKPDSVVSFLLEHGFTKAQISDMVRKLPSVLSCDPQKILWPKIEFFKSSGFSEKDLALMLSSRPILFRRSLEKYLIPAFGLLRDLFQSKEGTVSSFSFDNLLCVDLQATWIRNIEYLKELGVPESNIVTYLQRHPRTFSPNHNKFRKIVDDVKDKRLIPTNRNFLLAVYLFGSISRASWDKRIQIYRSWGFSQEEIFEALRENPNFITHSPNKIMDVMHYLTKRMGFRSSVVIRQPQLMGLSLQKRIIPRCSVYEVLIDKSLVPPSFSSVKFLLCPENKFLKNYVERFEEHVPGLLMLYKRNLPGLT